MENSQSNKPSLFGRSLQLADGDLNLIEGDFVMVAGRDNFLQSLQVMIETPFATDIFNINYGFDLLASIGQPHSVRLLKELIRLQVVKTLSRDNRVREIREVVFDDDPRFFELHPAQPMTQPMKVSQQARIEDRSWQALVLLETISEGAVVVRLEGVGL